MIFFAAQKYLFFIFIFAWTLAMPAGAVYGGDDSFTQKDREMLIRLDERLNQIDKRFEQIEKRFEQIDKRFEQVDKRFEQIDKRFEQIDKRFEQVNKRFEQVDKRFDELRADTNRRFGELREDMNNRFESFQTLMTGIVATFGALVAAIIGFALWDRRTMIRPFESKVKEIEAQLNSHDVLENKKNISRLIEALKKLGKHDPKIVEALKSVSLL